MVSQETRERASRHALEIIVVSIAMASFSGLGVFSDEMPSWLLTVIFVLGAALIVVAYTAWGRDADRRGVHLRIVVQCGVLTMITYATGWGFALPLVHLFAVADNVKYAGSSAVRSAVRVAFGWTLVAQTLLQFGWVPSIHEPLLDTWAIAAFMILAVAAVSVRIERMTLAREAAEQDLRNSERRFRSLVEDSSDVVLVVRDGKITYQSPSAQTVLGYAPEEVMGMDYLAFVHDEDRQDTITRVLNLLEDPSTSRLIECRIQHASGHWVPVETSVRNLNSDTLVGGFVLNLRDITERKALEAQIEHRAFHDALTGLPNRALFRDRVDHLLARAQRNSAPAAVLYLDLDGFKVVNDTQGHGVGDAVLVEVARRIDETIRGSDTAARLGGDEFAILLEDFEKDEAPARAAERILEALREPIVVDGVLVDVAASIGIATWTPGWTGEELVRNADIAMYMAKSSGKGRYELFESSMHVAVVERLEIERDLQRALERGEFLLHYQPIVSLEDRHIVGVEALVRWQHAERGMVSPGEFIPIAEETGMILPLGRWVLRTALEQAVAWQHAHPTNPPLHVSVNVSMKQLAHGDVVRDVREALADSGIDPASVVLELTESALVHDAEKTAATLTELKRLGVRLAIDDFGTGYSSLAYLQKFPLDILKIDRSFVEGVVRGTQSPALVRAIIDMSRSLDLETVAEGIEHSEELQRVKAMRCNLGQGYLFARPAGAIDIGTRLADQAASRSGVVAPVE